MIVWLLAVLGLLVGSFLNVVVYRVPRGESVVEPGSHCPACGHAVRWYDNVPIISWLVLRGRCRDCGAPISPRYLLVEAATGMSFALVAAATFEGTWATGLLTVVYCYAAAAGIALVLIDIAVHRLPDAIVLPSINVVAVGLAGVAAIGGDPASLVRAVLAGAACYLFYLTLVVIYPAGMGLGDVKLAAVIGLLLGWSDWSSVIVGVFGAFLLAGIGVVVLALLGRAGRKTAVAFGPYMIAGAVVGVTLGETIGSAYVGLLA